MVSNQHFEPLRILLLTGEFYPDEIGGIPISMYQFYQQFCNYGQKFSVFKYKINEGPSNHLTKILKCFTTRGELKIFTPETKDPVIYSNIKLFQSIKTLKFILKYAIRHFFIVFSWRESIRQKIYHYIKYFNKSMMFYPFLKDFLERNKIDLLLNCSVETGMAVLGYYFRDVKNIPFISFAHGLDFIHGRIERDPAKLMLDAVITRTKYTRKLLLETYQYPPQNVFVVPDGVVASSFEGTPPRNEARKILGFDENTFLVTTVCRLVFLKGVDLTIKAINHLRNKNPNLKINFYIIGNGEQKSNLLRLIETLNLTSSVKIISGLTNQQRNLYLSASDVFCMPSREFYKIDVEGFGLSFIEANYLSVPTIGARTGGIPEAMQENISGLLAERSNYIDLAEKIEFFIKNPDERNKIAKLAHQRIINDYLWDSIYKKHLEVFRHVALNRSSLDRRNKFRILL